jgi:dihydroorotase
LVLSGGRIERVGEGDFTEDFAGERIDASGCLVMPGAIDAHVHFREPGMEWKATMGSESRAAVAGGVTSVMDMPNTRPATTSLGELERKMEMAAVSSMCNYAFWLGATADNLEEVKRADPHTVAGVKVFMGSSTGGMLLDDGRVLSAVFAESPLLVGVHCEDEKIIRENMARYAGQEATAAVHPLVRTAEACYRSSARAVELADKYGTDLHVLHLTTERELSLFDAGPTAAKKITAEACTHHLWFTDADYPRLGNLIKVNPAIKTAADREALREGVLAGKIDTVATDHAPHTLDEKRAGYWDAPSGAPAIQHSLCTMLTLFPPEVVVEKMCHAPAVRFGVRGRGFLREGMHADIVIAAPREQVVAEPLYKCRWSPQQGAHLAWSIESTLIGGRLVYNRGAFDEEFRGEALTFR